MKRKTIIFGLLLTTMLFSGCGRNMESDAGSSSQDMNNTTESSSMAETENTTETTPMNGSDNTVSDQTTASSEAREPHTENTTMLTEQEAKQIALEKVPGATEDDIKKFKKDKDDTIAEYEGEIHYDGMEYEFEIHAYDGTILEWDEEPIEEMTR